MFASRTTRRERTFLPVRQVAARRVREVIWYDSRTPFVRRTREPAGQVWLDSREFEERTDSRIDRSHRKRSEASISRAPHSSNAFGFRTMRNGNPYVTSIRKRGGAEARPKSCRLPSSAVRTVSRATSPLANATIAATIRRTMPRRKLPARTSITIASSSRATSNRLRANGPVGGSEVNDRKSRSPRNSAPTSRSESTGRSAYRWYRYHRSMACRGWNPGGTSEYAHAQTPRARSLKAPTTASPRREESKAITFPTALTPRSVRLALRKNDAFGSRRILPARNAARHSPSTVRRSGWRWWPKNARPSYAILSATLMPRHISVTIYRPQCADVPRRPRRAEERGKRRRGRAGDEELRVHGTRPRESLPLGGRGPAAGDAGY